MTVLRWNPVLYLERSSSKAQTLPLGNRGHNTSKENSPVVPPFFLRRRM
ncbi:hypothetical protein AVEN_175092-1, partial [Araneus ventricosus]